VKGLPNIKSAIKRVKVTQSKTLKNVMAKSELKTSIKKFKESVEKKDAKAAESFKEAVKTIDKAAAKNLIHKNTAARRKSALAKALNKANVK
jgi:small subunit ribosomal protein S20